MAYGIQLLNGRNQLILGEGLEPYVISDMPWIGLRQDWGSWDEWGNPTGIKIGDINLPTRDSLLFLPWNGSVRGGAEGAASGRFYVHTDEGSVRCAIATPLKHVNGWRVYEGNYGMIVYNAAGQKVYDSRVPLLQTCGRFVGRAIQRGQHVSFDSGGANYVCQPVADLGISNGIWCDGFLRLTGQNSAVMAKAATEWISDWGGSYPQNLAANSTVPLLFAKINL